MNNWTNRRSNSAARPFSTEAPQGGFTLVELLIAMVIGGVIITAVYSTYLAQQRTYTEQEQVVEMQQNIRAAMDRLTRDIRTAGFDPTRSAGAKITTAQAGQFSFTRDITDNAGTGESDGDTNDPGEQVDYGFRVSAAAPQRDTDRDGRLDDTSGDGILNEVASLGRQTGGAGGYQPIADNIQAIEFRYLDKEGSVTANLNKINAVQISILARAAQSDPKFTNGQTYTPASGVAWDLNGPAAGEAPNDNFRRRLLIATVQCRNMGL